jgi:hypothetical protein
MRGRRPLARILVVILLAAIGAANFAHCHRVRPAGDLQRSVLEPDNGSTRLPGQPQSCLACQYLASASLTARTAPAVAVPGLARRASSALPALLPRRRLFETALPRGPPFDGTPRACCPTG